jgi:hypothetical protein
MPPSMGDVSHTSFSIVRSAPRDDRNSVAMTGSNSGSYGNERTHIMSERFAGTHSSGATPASRTHARLQSSTLLWKRRGTISCSTLKRKGPPTATILSTSAADMSATVRATSKAAAGPAALPPLAAALTSTSSAGSDNSSRCRWPTGSSMPCFSQV